MEGRAGGWSLVEISPHTSAAAPTSICGDSESGGRSARRWGPPGCPSSAAGHFPPFSRILLTPLSSFPSFLWESLSLLNIRLQEILLRRARQAGSTSSSCRGEILGRYTLKSGRKTPHASGCPAPHPEVSNSQQCTYIELKHAAHLKFWPTGP